MGQQARVNQNLAHAKLAQHEDVFDYTLQQLKRINGNCDALHRGHEELAASVREIREHLEIVDSRLIDLRSRRYPTTLLGRLRWVFRG